MEMFPLIIAMMMAVAGLILLLGGIGLLRYALWMRWYVGPTRQAANAGGVPEGRSEAALPITAALFPSQFWLGNPVRPGSAGWQRLVWVASVSGVQPMPTQDGLSQAADWMVKSAVGVILGFAGGTGLARLKGKTAG